MRWLHFRQLTKELATIFESFEKPYSMTYSSRGPYHWRIEIDHTIILCKLFHIGRNDNIVITNPVTWIKARKSEPIKIENRLLGVKKFLQTADEVREEAKKTIHTVAILHPDPLQIRQYINENEMIIVDINKKVYNYYFFSTSTLEKGFQQLLLQDHQKK